MPKTIGARGSHILWTLYNDGPYVGEARGKKPLVDMAIAPPAPWAGSKPIAWHDARAIRSSVKALRERGWVKTRRVLSKSTGRAQNEYSITLKGREEIERRLANYRSLSDWDWQPVREDSAPDGRLRWWVPDLVDSGWKVLLECSEQWGWRFKLTRPDGKESSWIYCSDQSEQGARAEARSTWRSACGAWKEVAS